MPGLPRFSSLCHVEQTLNHLHQLTGMVQQVPRGSRCAICWRPLLAAADTAGAEIAGQYRVVMSLGTVIIVCAGA
jgi:hypothetical protein